MEKEDLVESFRSGLWTELFKYRVPVPGLEPNFNQKF